MKRIASFLFSLLIVQLCAALSQADYRIVPLPTSVEQDTTKVFTLQAGMGISYDAASEEATSVAEFLRQWASTCN